VQVSFGAWCDDQEVTVLSFLRDGKPFEPHWHPIEDFVASDGSGLQTMKADQMCDCNVALGEHLYEIKFQTVSSKGKIFKPTFDVDLEVLAPAELEDVQVDDPTGGWGTPEPEEMQGIDCLSLCNNAASDAGASVSEPDTTVSEPGSTDIGAIEQAADSESPLTKEADDGEISDCSVANDLGSHSGFSRIFSFILSCYLL
jgi:hypothetical protein